MGADPIFVETEEEIPAVIERVRLSPDEEVQLVLPPRSRFAQSRFNFQLLKQYSTRLGKRVAIVAPDPAVQRMAEESGFPAHRGPGAPVPPAAPPGRVLPSAAAHPQAALGVLAPLQVAPAAAAGAAPQPLTSRL